MPAPPARWATIMSGDYICVIGDGFPFRVMEGF
jgi:hypothetical protein